MSHQFAQMGSAGERENAARKTVLVVEDEDALLHVLALILEEEGYRVLTARNGWAALDVYRDQGADVIITDFMMPDMGGGELLGAVHQERPRLPVIVMSSLEEGIVTRACLGHARFFRKPFDVPEFLNSVAALATTGGRDHLRLVK